MAGKTVQYLRPSFSGIVKVEFSEDSIRAGILSCHVLQAFLPSGEWIDLEKNVYLPDLDLSDLANEDQTLNVAIGLPIYAPGQAALAREGIDGRYRRIEPPENLPDLLDDSPDTEIERLLFNLRFLVGSDIRKAQKMEILNVARVDVSGGRFSLINDYAPHCIQVDAVPALARAVRAILEMLEARETRLSETARPWRLDGNLMDSGWLRDRLIHSDLAETVFRMNHQLQMLAPPETFYELLIVLMRRLAATGGISPPEPPVWELDDPCNSFKKIQFLLTGLLDQLRSGPDSIALFKPQVGWQEAQIPTVARVGKHTVFLVVKDLEEVSLTPVELPKLASITHIETIVSRALPGIDLHLTDRPPYGVSASPDDKVFRVNSESSLWQEVMSGGVACLHWPELPESCKVSLVFFRA